MEEIKVLYKIKKLDKTIIKLLFNDCGRFLDNERFSVTPTQMQIIEYILEHNEEVYQKDLEDVLNLSRATVSGVLQTMEKNGLIKRVIVSNDARKKKIIFKDIAKEKFEEKKVKVKELENVIATNISKEELEIFLEVLDKMQDNLNNTNN